MQYRVKFVFVSDKQGRSQGEERIIRRSLLFSREKPLEYHVREIGLRQRIAEKIETANMQRMRINGEKHNEPNVYGAHTSYTCKYTIRTCSKREVKRKQTKETEERKYIKNVKNNLACLRNITE